MNKKISIIGTVGIPAKYGGFETLTEYLTKHLSNDYDITVYCSAKSYPEQPEHYSGSALKYINLKANGVQSIPYDIVSFFKARRHADTILVLGVSGCIILPFIKSISQSKMIVNIDGLEWKRQKWNKYAQWFLSFSEKQAVNFADVVITDNKVIQDYVQEKYGKSSELIAYGADHVEKIKLSNEILDKYPFLKQRYAFTVCRIEPENNLHIILEAMARQQSLSLIIIGNWQASQYGIEIRHKYKDFVHIHLLDPIYDQQILNQIRSNSYIYLHGHSAGGTNPSLVEAMFLGLPTFAYGVDYNKETTEQAARYYADAKELAELINQSDEKLLQYIGHKMSEIANRRYRWEIIAEQYAALL